MILTRTYERDYSDLVTKINHPGGRYTRYCYDKLGRVIRTDYYDKTYENFTYNKNGALIEVENQYGKVKFERDSLGRITKEWQGRQFFYDEEGNLAKKIEPDGRYMDVPLFWKRHAPGSNQTGQKLCQLPI